MKKVVKYVILLMALGLAGTVALVSVSGLLKLFAGVGTLGAIIFWAMEISKIVLTTAIHNFKIKWHYKLAATLMIILAMGVTSIGVYGFLSSGYKSSFANLTATENRVKLIEEKRHLIDGDKELITQQIESKRERIKDQSSIRDQQETRLDSLYARRWYSAARRTEKAIQEANDNITKLEGEIGELNKRMNVANDSLSSYNLQIIDLQQNNEASNELGPLIYLSDVSGMSMDDVMKWLILVLMFLGDPLAVLLVVIFNIISKREGKKVEEVKEEKTDDKIEELVKEYEESVENLPKPKEEKFDPEIDYWEEARNEDDPKYIISHDLATPESTTMFKVNEDDNLEVVEPTELPSEDDESKTLEESEDEYTYGVEQPTELSTEFKSPGVSFTEHDDNVSEESVLGELDHPETLIVETENTKKYKLDIEELPEVESDKVNRYNVELPKTEVRIEEQEVEDPIVDEAEDKEKNTIKGKARRTDEGYEAIIDEEFSEEEKKKVVKEILDKKNAEQRGFSKLIPKRDPNAKPNKNVYIRKRRGK